MKSRLTIFPLVINKYIMKYARFLVETNKEIRLSLNLCLLILASITTSISVLSHQRSYVSFIPVYLFEINK